jgi:VanZ family protein
MTNLPTGSDWRISRIMLNKSLWTVFFLGLSVVIVLSVIPAEAFPNLRLSDIVGHMAAYAVLAVAGGIACRRAQSFFMLAAGLIALGACLEFAQALLPTRDASGSELLANFVGVALGSTATIVINVLLTKRWRGA